MGNWLWGLQMLVRLGGGVSGAWLDCGRPGSGGKDETFRVVLPVALSTSSCNQTHGLGSTPCTQVHP